jgi:outer membrane protein TolC
MKTNFVLTLLFVINTATRAAEPAEHHTSATNTARLTPAYVSAFAELLRINNPSLRAFDARTRAASHATNAVRTWDDPTFKFGGVVASSRGPNLSEEGDLIYGVEQRLPLFGKADAARRVARAEADSELARQSMQFEVLRRDLARLLFKAAYEEQSLVIGHQDLAWLETMTTTAEERYRAGSGSQVEVLRMQNERAKRADQLRTDALLRDHSLLAVNRLLNRELRAPLPKFELPPVAALVPYSTNLTAFATRSEPRLHLLAREIAAAEAQAAATRKTRLPDVSAGIEGRQYSGDGGFREGMFTVSLSLPWFNRGKYNSDSARARARLEAAELDRADYELSVREEVHRLTVALDAARREALLARDELLPRSRQAMESAHAQWLNGRGLFNDVMESRRMLLEAQLSFAKAVAEQHQAMSDLVLACGLDGLEALTSFALPSDSTPAQP